MLRLRTTLLWWPLFVVGLAACASASDESAAPGIATNNGSDTSTGSGSGGDTNNSPATTSSSSSGAAGAGGGVGGSGGDPCPPGSCLGELQWVRQGGGINRDYAYGVDVAPDGSVYVLGTFANDANFNPGASDEVQLSASGEQDASLMRLSADGDLLWAVDTSGMGEDNGVRLGAVAGGGVVTTGWITEGAAVTFGPGTTNATSKSAVGLEDVYLARYDAQGALSWVTTAGGSDTDRPTDIAVADDGGSVVVGRHWGDATFGAGEAGQTLLPGDGSGARLFVASYLPGGTLAWARSVAGSASIYGEGIALDPSDGSVVVSGKLNAGSYVFGAGEPQQTNLSVAGGSSFLARYEADGSLRWARVIGESDAPQGAEGRDVVVTSSGDLVVASSLFGSATFGAGTANAATVNASVSTGLVLSRHDGDGELLSLQSVTSGYCWSYALAATGDDGFVTAGIFKGSASFPSGTTLVSQGAQNDAFVARYAADGTLLWLKQAGGADASRGDYGYAVALGPDDAPVVAGQFAGYAHFGPGEPGAVSLSSTGSHDMFVAKLHP
jgi:hypothetical protein